MICFVCIFVTFIACLCPKVSLCNVLCRITSYCHHATFFIFPRHFWRDSRSLWCSLRDLNIQGDVMVDHGVSLGTSIVHSVHNKKSWETLALPWSSLFVQARLGLWCWKDFGAHAICLSIYMRCLVLSEQKPVHRIHKMDPFHGSYDHSSFHWCSNVWEPSLHDMNAAALE